MLDIALGNPGGVGTGTLTRTNATLYGISTRPSNYGSPAGYEIATVIFPAWISWKKMMSEEEKGQRPGNRKSQTGFCSLVRAKRDKRMVVSLTTNGETMKFRNSQVFIPASISCERLCCRL